MEMRIGSHAVPITAGVLRGQRARFQLFGDNVNISLSSGIKWSQRQNSCVGAGWLTPREGQSEAKGKGKLKAFFVSVDRHNGRSTRSETKATLYSRENKETTQLLVLKNILLNTY